MSHSPFVSLGRQIKQARLDAGMTQRDLASRVGRNAVRISEFERDLVQDRWGRDRLTLLVEICDALGINLMLVPRAHTAEVEALLRRTPRPSSKGDVTSAFDDLFVDLGNDEGER